MINFIYESPKININNYIPFSKPAVEFGDSATRLIRGFFILGIAMPRRKSTTEEFIKKAKFVHGDRYDYSLVEYSGSFSKVLIICKKHGFFNKTAATHLKGGGCRQCHNINASNTKEFLKKARIKHGNKYNYSLLEYTRSNKKIKIICPEHGVFEQIANNHLRNSGCLECSYIDRAENQCSNHNDFIKKAKLKHGLLYSYERTLYKRSFEKVEITCRIHGDFKQYPASHVSGQGCPECKKSNGELHIKRILLENKIQFEEQKMFPNCKNIKPLKYDFYIEALNTCIEYDGLQHFKPVDFYGGEKAFKTRQFLDKIKTDFCKNNGINLLRIAYNENIEQKLKEAGIAIT